MSELEAEPARTAAIAWLEDQGIGQSRTRYRLRDWLFSRQLYWDPPFLILHRSDGTTVPLPEDSLPLLAPEPDNYKPTPAGDPPRAGRPAGCRPVTRLREWRYCEKPLPCRNGPVPAGANWLGALPNGPAITPNSKTYLFSMHNRKTGALMANSLT